MMVGRFVWRLRGPLPAAEDAEAAALAFGLYDMLVADPAVPGECVDALVALLCGPRRYADDSAAALRAFADAALDRLDGAACHSLVLSELLNYFFSEDAVCSGSDGGSVVGSSGGEDERSDAEDGGDWFEGVQEASSCGDAEDEGASA